MATPVDPGETCSIYPQGEQKYFYKKTVSRELLFLRWLVHSLAFTTTGPSNRQETHDLFDRSDVFVRLSALTRPTLLHKLPVNVVGGRQSTVEKGCASL